PALLKASETCSLGCTLAEYREPAALPDACAASTRTGTAGRSGLFCARHPKAAAARIASPKACRVTALDIRPSTFDLFIAPPRRRVPDPRGRSRKRPEPGCTAFPHRRDLTLLARAPPQ